MIGLCGHELTGRQRSWCSPDCQKNGARAARLRAVFNLTPADYDLILAEQGGGCAICGRTPDRIAHHVDHEHSDGTAGLVRGILCVSCNLRLVARHRNGRLLRAAADYLDDPPARRALGRDVIAPGRPRRKRNKRIAASRNRRRRTA